MSGSSGKGVRIALFMSLALNLLVLGIGVGMVTRGPDHRPPRAVDLSLGPLTRALSDGDRAALNRAMRRAANEQGQTLPGRAARQQERQALIEALRADPFERARLEGLLSRQRERAHGWAERGHGAFVDRIEGMSPAARAAFADRLSKEIRERR